MLPDRSLGMTMLLKVLLSNVCVGGVAQVSCFVGLDLPSEDMLVGNLGSGAKLALSPQPPHTKDADKGRCWGVSFRDFWSTVSSSYSVYGGGPRDKLSDRNPETQ